MVEIKDNPSYECGAYLEQISDMVIVNDCYVGTQAITAKKQTYLRKYGAETDKDFAARCSGSKFWNAFRRTVHGLVGLIFRKNPVLDKDVPPEIKTQLENVDMQGTHVDVFAKERCTKGMIDGHSFIFIDMPQSVVKENPDATLADEKAAKLRPYWVPVNKNQILNYKVDKSSGYEQLSQVTIKECIKESVGKFTEKEVVQYRVLYPGKWEIYRESAENKGEWVLVDFGSTSLNYIPLVPFYALQTGFFQSTPPLLDVAHENLRHYNLQSSLDRILDLCNVPTPVLKGRPGPPYDDLVVGNGVIDIPVDGAASYLEPTGAAISSTQDEIDRCKANIASLGLLLLSSQPKVTKTATETTVEYTAETSELAAIARNLEDALERAVLIHADYLGLDTKQSDGGSVKVNKDFMKLGIDPQKIQAYTQQVKEGILTHETMWLKLVEAEELSDAFDPVKERKALGVSLTQAQTIKALTDSGASIKSAAMAAGVSEELAMMLQITDEPTGVVQ